jgi:chromosomal replication initiation ATPase DnaA
MGIYLLKKYTCATNGEIGALFGGVTYSAVAKTAQSFSQKMAQDHKLQIQIERLLRNSKFKV